MLQKNRSGQAMSGNAIDLNTFVMEPLSEKTSFSTYARLR
jgi:hypothetical protein